MLIVLITLLSGCYWQKQVEGNQVGLRMNDGVSINAVDGVVGPGRYSSGLAWYAEMEVLDVSAKTAQWEDPDLWTKDKQPLYFKVGVTYRRKSDNESVRMMWANYNTEARDDAALEQQVRNRVPRVAKAVTVQFTLDEMLGITGGEAAGRGVITQKMSELLAPELAEFGVELLDVGVNDIGVDPDYAAKLKEKAQAQINTELAAQKSLQLAEQVKQETAQTAVDLEIARRNNLVAQEQNKVYVDSPQAFELKRLELLQNVIGDSDKIYFVPEGADLTLLLGGNTNTVTPVQPK